MKTPSQLSAYATDAEIAQAVAELRARAQTLASALKAARAEARKVHPLADFRPRTRNGRSAARVMEQALPAEARVIVTRAKQLAEHRDAATRAANYLTWVNADLARATIVAAVADEVTGEECPTFRAVIGRWQMALAAAGEKMMPDKQARKAAALEAKLDSLRRRADKLLKEHRG